MIKTYTIIRVGDEDAYKDHEADLVGKIVEADPEDIGHVYPGALSGFIKKEIIIPGVTIPVKTFHELYLEEVT